MKKRSVFLLLILLLLTACASQASEQTTPAPAETLFLNGPEETPFLNEPEETPVPSGEPVEAEQEEPEVSERERQIAAWQEDYELLWTELEESYPYLPYLESEGFDVPAIRESFAAEIPTLRDEAAFVGLIRRLTASFGNFAHFDLVPPELYQTYYYAYVGEGVDAGPEKAAFAAVLQDGRLNGMYQPPAEADVYLQTRAGTYREAEIRYDAELKALTIKIRSFAQETVERDRHLVRQAIEQYPEAEHVIFDITGNSGGSDWYWMQNIVAPFGGSYSFDYRNFYRSAQTSEAFYGHVPSVETSSLTDAPDWALDLGLDRCFLTQAVLPEEGGEAPITDCTARRWVLIDERVYSASDKFAAFCKATGWATLVGRPSRGDGLGTTPVLVLLPNTGLLVRFSATAGENPNGSMNARIGTAPDYLCVKRETPQGLCEELIRSHK